MKPRYKTPTKVTSYFSLILLALIFVFFPADSKALAIEGGCPPSYSSALKPAEHILYSAITFCEKGDLDKKSIKIKLTASELEGNDVLYAGYIKNHPDVKLEIRLPSGERKALKTSKTGDDWFKFPPLDLPPLPKEAIMEIILTDSSSEWTGWGGIAVAEKQTLAQKPLKYAKILGKTFLTALLLLTPGFFLAIWPKTRMHIAFLPIPGSVLLAIAGAFYWAAPPSLSSLLQVVLYILYAILLLSIVFIALKEHRNLHPLGKETRFGLLAFALCFAQALIYGSNPLPVAQEYGEATNLPGRMVASPPDHGTPHMTALYMYKRYDGLEESKNHFGEWNVTSRGPLVPLGINAIYHLIDPKTQSHTDEHAPHWITEEKGAKYASIYGWLLNASIVLGCLYLVSGLTSSVYWQRIALTWAAISPVVTINTVFLWPKLLAVYFIALAIGATLRNRHLLAGALMSLAWLSHPIGALMLPIVLLFMLLNERAEPKKHFLYIFVRRATLLASGMLPLIGPWLLYKASLGHPDMFFSYVLGAGKGFIQATSFQEWLSVRWSNFWLTISPGAFFYTENMKQWLYGPLSEPLRWNIQYAKTLPGSIGFLAYPIAMAALLLPLGNKKTLDLTRNILIIGSFLVMLVFWGFSGDGLGRNCLEPVAIFLMLYTSALENPFRDYLPRILWITALESLFVQASGFFFHMEFSISNMKIDSTFLILLNAGILFMLTRQGTKKTSMN